MFGFVINKLKNRKWLNLCLLMGVALFIALFVCHPMFEKGACTDEPRGNICGGRLS